MVSDDALLVLLVTLALATLHYLVPPRWVSRMSERAGLALAERARAWLSSEDGTTAVDRRVGAARIAMTGWAMDVGRSLVHEAAQATRAALADERAELAARLDAAEPRLREMLAAAVADGLGGLVDGLREEASKAAATPEGASALASGGLAALSPLVPAKYRPLLALAPAAVEALGLVRGQSGAGTVSGRGGYSAP